MLLYRHCNIGGAYFKPCWFDLGCTQRHKTVLQSKPISSCRLMGLIPPWQAILAPFQCSVWWCSKINFRKNLFSDARQTDLAAGIAPTGPTTGNFFSPRVSNSLQRGKAQFVYSFLRSPVPLFYLSNWRCWRCWRCWLHLRRTLLCK